MDQELVNAYEILREGLNRRGLLPNGLTRPVHRDLTDRQRRLLKAYTRVSSALETQAADLVETKLKD